MDTPETRLRNSQIVLAINDPGGIDPQFRIASPEGDYWDRDAAFRGCERAFPAAADGFPFHGPALC